MKTILWNSYYVNPQAYLVFPSIQEPEKSESYIEPCNIQGQIEIIIGDTRDIYKDINTIDFSKYKGNRIRIEQYTEVGSVVLGEWQIEGTNQVEYVDLGLPSGLLWSKCNLGATSEEEPGLYFQWGDIQGYTAEQVGNEEGQKVFSWNDYKFSIEGSSSNFSKYNASDSKTILDLEDDAAHVMIGSNWRMPTSDDFVELCQNTDLYLVSTEGEEIKGNITENGIFLIYFKWESNPSNIKGVKFYKKDDRGTYLFVPAAGDALDGSLSYVGNSGYLWTSSLYSSSVTSAWGFFFGSGYGCVYSVGRLCGLPIRGVCNVESL